MLLRTIYGHAHQHTLQVYTGTSHVVETLKLIEGNGHHSLIYIRDVMPVHTIQRRLTETCLFTRLNRFRKFYEIQRVLMEVVFTSF